jgi:hypothetical protein
MVRPTAVNFAIEGFNVYFPDDPSPTEDACKARMKLFEEEGWKFPAEAALTPAGSGREGPQGRQIVPNWIAPS